MLNLFKKQTPFDFSGLGADMHSHLLPGIDDGAKDMEDSLSLIRQMRAMGFSALFTTPHVMSGLYPNSRDRILFKRDEVREALLMEGIHLTFDAAAEYFIDEEFEQLYKKEALLTLPGNYVLVEMSTMQPYPRFHEVLFDLQMKGYKPVLAHPERYGYYESYGQDAWEEICAKGCLLQINLLSLTDYYTRSVKKQATRLLEYGLVSFLGSDVHHERHAEKLNILINEGYWIRPISQNRIINHTFTATNV